MQPGTDPQAKTETKFSRRPRRLNWAWVPWGYWRVSLIFLFPEAYWHTFSPQYSLQARERKHRAALISMPGKRHSNTKITAVREAGAVTVPPPVWSKNNTLGGIEWMNSPFPAVKLQYLARIYVTSVSDSPEKKFDQSFWYKWNSQSNYHTSSGFHWFLTELNHMELMVSVGNWTGWGQCPLLVK